MVQPAIAASAADLAPTATTLTIQGYGFSSTVADNTVVFSNGVKGKISYATSTELIVIALTGLKPGELLATVTVKWREQHPGAGCDSDVIAAFVQVGDGNGKLLC